MLRTTYRMAAVLFLVIIFITAGCSGQEGIPVAPAETGLTGSAPRDTASDRYLWGLWELKFDAAQMKVVAIPVRALEAHYDITFMVIPPACDDCVDIVVNSFDPVTRILDADVSLRNPTPVSGHDVRGILYTDLQGHLLTNPDGWTDLYDAIGGQDINPFKAFAKTNPERIFGGLQEHTENYLVYIPQPPAYQAIRFAVDASWPGNCKEPYVIQDFEQQTVLYDVAFAVADLQIVVHDWQGDAGPVRMEMPEILGMGAVEFSHVGGDIWYAQAENTLGAVAGDYDALAYARSANSGSLTLYQEFNVTVTEALVPNVYNIDPDTASQGDNLIDVTIMGGDFEGPGAQVKLRKPASPDIAATNVVVQDISTVTCDISIPPIADTGSYSVEVTNGTGKSGVGDDLFEVLEFGGWTRTWGYGNTDYEYCADVTVDDSGNIYACGYFEDTIDFDPGDGVDDHMSSGDKDAFLVKYDPIGNYQWTRTWGAADGDVANGVGCDGFGDVYTVGFFTGIADFDPGGSYELSSHGQEDAYLTKFDTSGNHLWALNWGSLYEDSSDTIAISGDEYLYVGGIFRGTTDFDPGPGEEIYDSVAYGDAYLTCFDLSGDHQWSRVWGGAFNQYSVSIAIGGLGGIYVSGRVNGTTDFDPGPGVDEFVLIGDWDVYVTKYSNDGTYQWARAWGGSGQDWMLGVDADSSDNVYATGYFNDTVDFDPGGGSDEYTSAGNTDAFVSKFSSSGDYQYALVWGSTGSDMGYQVAVDDSDNFYITGRFNGTVDLDPGPMLFEAVSNGGADCSLSMFYPDGSFMWAVTYGGLGNEQPIGCVLDNFNNVVTAGQFEDFVDFDPGPGVDEQGAPEEGNYYIQKLRQNGTY